MLAEPELVNVAERKLIGQQLQMSFAENTTPLLWKSFMPQRRMIRSIDDNLFSAALYPNDFFDRFHPETVFEKWAAVEVEDFSHIPGSMEKLVIPAGLYAKFHYKGSPDDAPEVYRHIFNDWLPKSTVRLDNRPHFEILGEQYKNGGPDSEEDIYIPVRRLLK